MNKLKASGIKEPSTASTLNGQMGLKERSIYGNRLLIWRNVQSAKPVATNLWAVLPSDQWDSKEAVLYDWKADASAGTIYARGEIYLGSGNYQRFDDTFPCQLENVPLKPPGRNFEWNELSGNWRNVKTGERRKAT